MKTKLLFLLMLVSYTLSSQIIYVDQNATGSNNGTDWANAYTDLQTAIANIGSNTTINVAQGTYYPTATTDRTIYFNIPRDKKLFGGFPTGGGTRDPELYPTILSGDIGTLGDNTDNSYHVVYFYNSSSTNEFDGFTVEKGYADGSGTNENLGGGILVKNNSSGSYGLYLRNCVIRYNFAETGGGIAISKKADIYNCKIYSNQATNGGGINNSTDGRIYNSFIVNNSATNYGGGISVGGFNDVPSVINCVVANNEAPNGSGGSLSRGKFINCTIANNKGTYAVYFILAGYLENNIIWRNEITTSQVNIPGSSADTYLQHNLVQDLTPFATNFSLSSSNNGVVLSENYPRFTKPTSFTGNATNQTELDEILNADWSINPQSAAIDFGDNSLYPSSDARTPSEDIIGNNRTINTTMDAGAYEALTNIITTDATNRQPTSASLNGEVLFAETANTITRGFVYASTPNFDVTTATSVTNSATGLGVYSDNITGLTENQLYYYRTWVEFDGVTYYGNEIQFKASNLVAYYPFNGNANDESGNGNNGTVNGATLTTDRNGNADSAYSFDGNDIITIAHNDILNCSDELSISVWVKPNSLQDAMILGKSNYTSTTNYLLRTKSTGYIAFEYKDFANSNSLPLTANVWNHIAVISKSDNSKQVYINGVLATHTSDTSPFGLVTNALTIGARSGAEFFNGSIDDLRIYKSALTESNVLNLYNNNSLDVADNQLKQLNTFYVFNNILYFGTAQNLSEIKNISIYNILAQKVYKSTEIQNELSLDFLDQGIYILKIELNNGKVDTKKFLIQ